jgi:hypothetical protein
MSGSSVCQAEDGKRPGRVGGAGPLAQVDQLIGGLLEPEPLGQGGDSGRPALAIETVPS